MLKEPKSKQQIRNYFECGVCLEQFNGGDKFPRILVCGHTFCTKCISQIIGKQVQFKCPYCNSNLGLLRLGQAYKNYSLLKLLSINGIQKSQTLSYTIDRQTYAEIVDEMDHIPKDIEKLIIKRNRDDQKNPFQFDLIRSNKHSMRFYHLLVTFQKLKHFQLWIKYSAHGFQECLAESLIELKSLQYVKIVNAYDQYSRMGQIISLTSNEAVSFEIQIRKW